MIRSHIPLADAKKRLSELVSRVALGREEFVITRRGVPAALLARPKAASAGKRLSEVRGWLDDDDLIFGLLEQARRESRRRCIRRRNA